MMQLKKLLYLGLSTTLVACHSTKLDRQAPSLEWLSLSPTPSTALVCGQTDNNVIALRSDDSLRFELRFSDNEGLSQYKIDIHDNFDCHGHRSPQTASTWSVQTLGDLSGTEQILRLALAPPADVRAGDYHFQVSVLDESGNELENAQFYTLRLLNVQDSIAPQWQSSTISAGDTLTLATGTALQLSANLQDNLPLEQSRAVLLYYTLSGNRIVAQTQDINTANTSQNVQFNYVLPSTLSPGRYEFQLQGYDRLNNRTTLTFWINIR
jgi:hypothetical protein